MTFPRPLLQSGRTLLVALMVVSCAAPLPAGSPLAADGLRLTVPPGWEARFVAPGETGRVHQLGWLANQTLDPACDPVSCTKPIERLTPAGILVGWFTYNCLPNCQLDDEGRTLIGGREASRQRAPGECGTLDAATSELVMVRVGPQRTDMLVACAGADAGPGLDAFEDLLASIRWTVP